MYSKHSIQIYLVFSVIFLDVLALPHPLDNFELGTELPTQLNIILPKLKTTLQFLLLPILIKLHFTFALEISFLVVDTNKTLVILEQLS